ncbi:hypothetical protein TgHK011_009806 [Trichoderma gracile]|nr:hypothetical protein TgHK011_009806 [Trichoderma gracile]
MLHVLSAGLEMDLHMLCNGILAWPLTLCLVSWLAFVLQMLSCKPKTAAPLAISKRRAAAQLQPRQRHLSNMAIPVGARRWLVISTITSVRQLFSVFTVHKAEYVHAAHTESRPPLEIGLRIAGTSRPGTSTTTSLGSAVPGTSPIA